MMAGAADVAFIHASLRCLCFPGPPQAGAGCEELKVRCPYYYTVARELHAAMQATLTADDTFPAFVLNTLRKRYKVGPGRAGTLRWWAGSALCRGKAPIGCVAQES